jgi:hypothetical protein
MTRAACLFLAAALALAGRPGDQQGSISGVILSGDGEGTPVARAIVTIAGAHLRPSLITMTDAAGRFVFADLPTGQFTLTAAKATFLSMAYGQITPGRGSGLPIALSPGQHVSGLTWKIPRGAVIRGRVVDDRGRPMSDAPIVLMQYRETDSGRALQSAACRVWPQTDGDGTYRVTGVPAGEYLVAALPPGGYVYMPEPFVPSGPETRQVTAAELQWALKELAGPSGASEPPSGPAVTYTRMFFPGSADPASATPVQVALGEERGGIDIAMRLLPSARIQGRVVGPDGQPVERPQVSMSGSSSTAPGSAFSRRNLTPGRYTIAARGANNTLWGRVTLDVNGTDLLDVEIKLGPAASVAGTIQFESASKPPPADASAVRVSLRPAPSGLPSVAAAANGSFAVRGVDPGRYRLQASMPAARGTQAGSPWVLKSAMLNGRDITDEAFEIGEAEQLSGVVVTFTDRPTELAGVLQDAAGQPAPGFYVVVFPSDRNQWNQGSRRLPPPVRSASDGTFRFAGLPAGAYYLAAMTSVDQADLSDAAFLQELARAAVSVTVAEDERTTQNLRFGKLQIY